jgi:hypothetical protein
VGKSASLAMEEIEEIERLAKELGEDVKRRISYRDDWLVRRMLLKRLRREKMMQEEEEERRMEECAKRREEEEEAKREAERRREARLAAARVAAAKRHAMPDVSCTVQQERYVVPAHSARPSALFTFCPDVPFGARGGGELKKPRHGK